MKTTRTIVTYEDGKATSVEREWFDPITNEWCKMALDERMDRIELRRAFHSTMVHEGRKDKVAKEKKVDVPRKA